MDLDKARLGDLIREHGQIITQLQSERTAILMLQREELFDAIKRRMPKAMRVKK